MDTCLDRLYKRVRAQGNFVLESELAQVILFKIRSFRSFMCLESRY